MNMQHKTITVDQVMSWQPCKYYPRDLVEDLSRKGSADAEHILGLKIPDHDKIWVLIHMIENLDCLLLASSFSDHVVNINTEATTKSLMASHGDIENPELYPAEEEIQGWKNGDNTEAQKRAGLAAMWAAVARGKIELTHERRIDAYNDERAWQLEQIKILMGV